MTNVTIYQNYGRWVIEGQVDLSAAGAVSAYRGDGITVAKNGTGLYDITIANPACLSLVEVLNTSAALQDAAVGTVKDVGVKSITQSATTGVVTMTVRTVNAAGADVDEASDALTVSFSAVIRCQKMTSTL